MKYKTLDANDLLTHGGRDNYTGDHADFNSVEQLRQSDQFDDLMVSASMGKSDVKTFDRDEIQNKSHMYSMFEHDLGASSGASVATAGNENIFNRNI